MGENKEGGIRELRRAEMRGQREYEGGSGGVERMNGQEGNRSQHDNMTNPSSSKIISKL